MSTELEKVLEDFIKERGNIPAYANILKEMDPDFLVKWFDIRRGFMGESALAGKYKEIVLAAGAAVRLYEGGVNSHVATALKRGATREEVLEGAMCVWLSAGMPSFSMYLNGLARAIEAEKAE